MEAKKLLTTLLVLLFLQSASNAQSYWQLGGNNDNVPAALGLLSISNYLGGTQTASVRFGTGGNSYMFIGGSIIPAYNGMVGIGNGYITPTYQLDIYAKNNNNGSIFRTTGSNLYDCDWESWVGSGTGTPSLYGRIYVPTGTTDFATGGFMSPMI